MLLLFFMALLSSYSSQTVLNAHCMIIWWTLAFTYAVIVIKVQNIILYLILYFLHTIYLLNKCRIGIVHLSLECCVGCSHLLALSNRGDKAAPGDCGSIVQTSRFVLTSPDPQLTHSHRARACPRRCAFPWHPDFAASQHWALGADSSSSESC